MNEIRTCKFCHRVLLRKTYKNSIEREDRFLKRIYCSAGCAGEDKKKSPEIAFLEKIDKNSSNKFYRGTRCWLWTGAVNFAGYGKLRVKGQIVSAHRYSLEVHLGRKLPPEQMACHHCDNPPCCNPDHLFVGSAKDNAIDMVQKRRDSYARQPWKTQFQAYLNQRRKNSNKI